MTWRTSVSLPDDVERDVEQDPDSLSGLVSDWLENYYVRGVPPLKAMNTDAIRERLVSARDHHEAAAEDLQAAIDIVDDAVDAAEVLTERGDGANVYDLSDAKEWWRKQPWSLSLDHENDAIKMWAERLEMESRELCDELSRVERDAKPDSLKNGDGVQA